MSDCCCPVASNDGAPGGVALEPWELVAEIDFAAEPALVDLTNGQHTLNDGRSWTAENRGAANVFRVNPGSGLEFTANATLGQWNTAPAQTASTLWISINDLTLGAGRQLIDDYDCNRQYLYQVRIVSTNADAATEGVYLNLWNPLNNQFTGAALAIGGAWHGSNATVLANRGVGGTSNTATPVLVQLANRYAGFNVVGMSSVGNPSALALSAGLYTGGAWPAMADLQESGYIESTATPAALTAPRYTDRSARLGISFPTGNTSATFSAIVGGVRVMARTPN